MSAAPMHEVLGRLARGQMKRAEFDEGVCRRGDGKLVRVRDVTPEDLAIHGAWLEAELEASAAELSVAQALQAQVEPHLRGDEPIAAALARGAIPADVRPAALALIALHEQWAGGGPE